MATIRPKVFRVDVTHPGLDQDAVTGCSPVGTSAAYSTYLGVLGYAIHSGGGPTTWTGIARESIAWLKRVQGLRTTVQRALSSGEQAK